MYPYIFAVEDLEHTISQLSINAVVYGSAIIILLTILAIIFSTRHPRVKLPIFLLIVLTVLGTTVTISGGTVYLNMNSDSGGPVHWHADFEVWACGNQMELRDPSGFLSNKIGTPTLHEHDDQRIHLEGVPVELPQDASLGKFMNVIGGELTDKSLKLPLNNQPDRLFEADVDGDGPNNNSPELIKQFTSTDVGGDYLNLQDGQNCGDQPSELQVFVYNYDQDKKTYTQRKLEDPASYAISPHSDIPPGDCVIFEYGPARDRTDKLCKQYGIRDINRCEQFGVIKREFCDSQEVQ